MGLVINLILLFYIDYFFLQNYFNNLCICFCLGIYLHKYLLYFLIRQNIVYLLLK